MELHYDHYMTTSSPCDLYRIKSVSNVTIRSPPQMANAAILVSTSDPGTLQILLKLAFLFQVQQLIDAHLAGRRNGAGANNRQTIRADFHHGSHRWTSAVTRPEPPNPCPKISATRLFTVCPCSNARNFNSRTKLSGKSSVVFINPAYQLTSNMSHLTCPIATEWAGLRTAFA